MTPLVKAVLALALVVPLVAYVAGSLASSGAETPERQGPVYIDDVAPASERSTSTTSPRRSTPGRAPVRPSPTRDNQPTQAPGTDEGKARVVTPTPVDDEGDDDGNDDGDDTDDVDDQDDERDDDRDDDTDDGDDTDD